MAVSSWSTRNDVMCETGAVARGVVKRCRKRGTVNPCEYIMRGNTGMHSLYVRLALMRSMRL